MDKENDIVYVKAKNGIFKCYESEQMHKPIYYPVESKTNGYIDYNDVIDILSSDDLYNELKKQKEVIDKAIKYINDNLIISSILDGKKYYTINNYSFDYRELLDILKEVSE